MDDIIFWPANLLGQRESRVNLVPYTRSGGRSLGGVEPATKTDAGYWTIELNDIPLYERARLKSWDAIAEMAGGRSGLFAVPVWSRDTAPYVSGAYEPPVLVPHDDDTGFSDGTFYQQGAISIQAAGETTLGATVISVRVIQGGSDLSGVRFSYQHALYKAGRILSEEDGVITLKISPPVRQAIPDGADLEFDMPTCLCRLADDRGMDRGSNVSNVDVASVKFNEATDFWNKLALGLI